MKISKLESALILTEALVELGPHAHEKEIYDEVYAFLDYAEEQAAESEELDEEDEYELTPASQSFLDAREAADAEEAYVDEMEAEFSPFSPSVGTFEGTDALAELVGAYKNVMQRGQVAERVWPKPLQSALGTERVHVPFNAAKTIGEAFTPCGAD